MGIRYNGHNISLNTIRKVRLNGHSVYDTTEQYQGFCITSQSDGTQVIYHLYGTCSPNIQKSTNGRTWTNWNGNPFTLNNGEKMYIRNTDNTLSTSENDYLSIYIYSGNVKLSGNIMSLVNFSSLTAYSFYKLFSDCRIVDAGELILPTENLTPYCFSFMFYACESLTSYPNLSAETLAVGCYKNMFERCRAITNAPYLPAQTLVDYCYYEMFKNCSGLKVSENEMSGTPIFTCPDTTGLTNPTYKMFVGSGGHYVGTPASGTTYSYYDYSIDTTITNGTSTGSDGIMVDGHAQLTLIPNAGYKLPSNITVSNCTYEYNSTTGVVLISEPTGNITISASCVSVNALCLQSLQDGSILRYNIQGTLTTVPDIMISDDGINWNTWDGTGITLNNGEYRYIKNGNNTLSESSSAYLYFVLTGNFKALGNIMSMINYSSLSAYCFYQLFRGCAITNASELSLPEMTMQDHCYSTMFQNSRLYYPPSLPATNLAIHCYSYMFNGCSLLSSAPSLPATILSNYCYYNMFKECLRLTSPPELPAETLAEHCYAWMFSGCTVLASAPSLPAQTLVDYCYFNMFSSCTVLASAPSLPATNLAIECYSYMFSGCTSLKVNENGSGNLIFTCPSQASILTVDSMFAGTGGTFTGTPTAGNSYYWYVETKSVSTKSLIKQFKRIGR